MRYPGQHHEWSNLVRIADMHLEIVAPVQLSRNMVFFACGGLYGTPGIAAVITLVRAGQLAVADTQLPDCCRERLSSTDSTQPLNPDDLAFLLSRCGSRR